MPFAQEIRAGIDKWHCTKLKILFTANETIRKNPQNERKFW
jgi:hypothetical protein